MSTASLRGLRSCLAALLVSAQAAAQTPAALIAPPHSTADRGTTERTNEAAKPNPPVYGTFYRGFGVASGRLAGRLGSQLGLTVGQRGFALMVGGMPGNQLLSLGVEVPRFAIAVRIGHSRELSMLWPSAEAHLLTDVSQNLHFNVGVSPFGLNYEKSFGSAGRRAFYLQLRAPMVVLWIPVKVDDAWITRHSYQDRGRPEIQRASPFLSLGVGLEAGIAL
jgi:hypothetical protein